MYAAIRQGKVKPGVMDEVKRQVETGAIPIIKGVPGFQAYYLVYAEDNIVTTISIFDSQTAADESNRLILDWIRQNLAPLLEGAPQATAGQVVFHQASG